MGVTIGKSTKNCPQVIESNIIGKFIENRFFVEYVRSWRLPIVRYHSCCYFNGKTISLVFFFTFLTEGRTVKRVKYCYAAENNVWWNDEWTEKKKNRKTVNACTFSEVTPKPGSVLPRWKNERVGRPKILCSVHRLRWKYHFSEGKLSGTSCLDGEYYFFFVTRPSVRNIIIISFFILLFYLPFPTVFETKHLGVFF